MKKDKDKERNTKKKYWLYLLPLVIIAIITCILLVCGGSPGLGKEFSLSVGQTVSISGENLQITFDEVSQDSRCPTGAECVWEGVVICQVSIVVDGITYHIELAQLGLSDEYASELYKNYRFTFKVEPYPEPDKEIAESEYRLLLTVSR